MIKIMTNIKESFSEKKGVEAVTKTAKPVIANVTPVVQSVAEEVVGNDLIQVAGLFAKPVVSAISTLSKSLTGKGGGGETIEVASMSYDTKKLIQEVETLSESLLPYLDKVSGILSTQDLQNKKLINYFKDIQELQTLLAKIQSGETLTIKEYQKTVELMKQIEERQDTLQEIQSEHSREVLQKVVEQVQAPLDRLIPIEETVRDELHKQDPRAWFDETISSFAKTEYADAIGMGIANHLGIGPFVLALKEMMGLQSTFEVFTTLGKKLFALPEKFAGSIRDSVLKIGSVFKPQNFTSILSKVFLPIVFLLRKTFTTIKSGFMSLAGKIQPTTTESTPLNAITGKLQDLFSPITSKLSALYSITKWGFFKITKLLHMQWVENLKQKAKDKMGEFLKFLKKKFLHDALMKGIGSVFSTVKETITKPLEGVLEGVGIAYGTRFLPKLGNLGGMFSILGRIVPGAYAAWDFYTRYKAEGGLGGAIKSFIFDEKGKGTATRMVSRALSLGATGMAIGGPIGGAIGAAIGLITGYIGPERAEKFYERTKEFFGKPFKALKDMAVSFADKITKVWTKTKKVKDKLVNLLGDFWDSLKEKIEKVIEAIKHPIDSIKGLWNWAKGTWHKVTGTGAKTQAQVNIQTTSPTKKAEETYNIPNWLTWYDEKTRFPDYPPYSQPEKGIIYSEATVEELPPTTRKSYLQKQKELEQKRALISQGTANMLKNEARISSLQHPEVKVELPKQQPQVTSIPSGHPPQSVQTENIPVLIDDLGIVLMGSGLL